MSDVHQAIRTAIQDHDEERVLSLLTDPRCEIRKTAFNTGDTLLHEAIRADSSAELIRDLIAAGVPIDQCNELGETALYLAAARGQEQSALALIEANANPSTPTIEGRQALDEAINQVLVNTALALITRQEHVSNTSLIDAVRLHDPRPALALLARGVNPNIVEPHTEMRAIHYAAQGAPIEITQALIRAGASLNDYDSNRKTPLMHAAFDGQKEITRLLLEAGADPRIPDQQGRTPLIIAVGRIKQGVVDALLEHPLGRETIDQPNRAGVNPVDIARLDGHGYLVDQLLDADEQGQER